MFCDKCGELLHEGSKYCDHCGSTIIAHDAEKSAVINTAPFSPSQTNRKESFWNHKATIISVVFILLAIGIFTAYGYFENGGTNQISFNQSSSLQQTSTATSTVLSVAFINPSNVAAPYENVIAINGSGFQNGATVQAGTTNLDLSGVVVANLIYAKYPGNFKPGIYNITVTNPDGSKYTLNQALKIQQSSPQQVSNQASATELSSSQIVSQVKPSVVLIRTDLGCGSGMIIKNDGTILTDDHVISGTNYINVYLSNGTMYSASVIRTNTTQDLALIKIADTGLPTVNFGDSTSINLGANVIALGYPLTCNQNQVLEADPGIVTARRTSAALGANAIQTSARINPGDSGGPLVDSYGNVVGINESIFTIQDFDFNVTGIAFATPSEVIEPFINNTSYYPQSSNSYAPSYTSNSGYSPQTPPSNPRQFTLNATGVCQNYSGNGTILLDGYPFTSSYSIPDLYYGIWQDGDVSFTVPPDVPSGTYQVTIRGYNPNTGYCPDVHGGSITVQ